MNRKLKKFLGIIIVVAMLFSAMPANVIASDVENAVMKEATTADSSETGYLTFSNEGGKDWSLETCTNNKTWDGTLYYSCDTVNWTEWDGISEISSKDGIIYLRGTGNTIITGSNYTHGFILSGNSISCTGNIMTLLDYEMVLAGGEPVMGNYAFNNFFADNKGLVSSPELPAMNLSENCYSYMFERCTNLKSAPKLPATTLTESCYNSMFLGCSSLVEAPELPAETLADYCYSEMFGFCYNLKIAPELPAKKLAEYCYMAMFNGCKSLTEVPELPGTSLANSCYNKMFNGCVGLKETPALNATELAPSCYYGMFIGCTALTEVPNLPATTLEQYCYGEMFKNCTGIELYEEKNGVYAKPWVINSSNSVNYWSIDMFKGTSGSFAGSPKRGVTYYQSCNNNHNFDNGICSYCEYECEHTIHENGICDNCGICMEPQLTDNYYQIANTGNLIWFGNYVNLGNTSANAKLVADIDLNNLEWTPIKNYIGEFDGAGYTISNYLVSKITYGGAELGFFESILAPAVVKNFKISGLIKATTYGYSPRIIGGVVARSGNDSMSDGGTVTGVTSSVKIQSVAGISITHVGGVIGAMYGGEVSGCVYDGKIVYSGSTITELGGIVGYAQNGTIKNCGNVSDIYSAFNHAGGILGYTNSANTNIINCFNYANVKSTNAGYAGGIVGRLRAHGTVTGNYYNYDKISSGYGPSSDGNMNSVEIMRKTSTQFESGQIAYLLNQAQDEVDWKQTLGEHSYPVFEGETVHYHTDNECSSYTNTADGSHSFKSDNCSGCDFATVLLSSERFISKFDASVTFIANGENVTYQWYAANSQNLDDSVIIRGAVSKTILPIELLANRNQETVYKYIYCIATKQVNGETVTETSPLCLNAFNQITEADATYIDFSESVIYTDSTDNINNFSNIVNIEDDIQSEVNWTPSYTYGDSVKAYGTGSQLVIGADAHNSTSFTVIVYGDINGDGVVDAIDGAELSKTSNNLSTFDSIYQSAADIDENGVVDAFDYQAVINKIVA